MFRFLSKCLGVTGGRATRMTAARTKPPVRPQLESLEDRQLLTATATLSTHILTIQGTPQADRVFVQKDSGLHFPGTPAPQVWVRVYDHGKLIGKYAPSQVSKIVFHGGAGDDYFDNRTNINCKAYGEAGNDTLMGGGGRDILYGGYGSDKLYGRGNEDYLNGGNPWSTEDGCYDRLEGGTGADTFALEAHKDLTVGDYPVDFRAHDRDQVLYPATHVSYPAPPPDIQDPWHGPWLPV